jgi:hypothetical protein
MVRTRIKLAVVAGVVAIFSSFGMAPAHAAACHPDPLGPDVSGEEEICRTVLSVICAPFAKSGGCPIA